MKELNLICDNGRNEYSREFWADYLWPWVKNENWVLRDSSYPNGEDITDEDDHPIDLLDGKRGSDPETGEAVEFYQDSHLLYSYPAGWEIGLVDGELVAVEDSSEVPGFVDIGDV